MSNEGRENAVPFILDKTPLPARVQNRVVRNELPAEVIEAIRESRQHSRDNESFRNF